MRFLIDMPLSPDLAISLRKRGHDAIHASHVGLETAEDRAILTRAIEEKRIVITADLDYPRLLAFMQTAGPGLILFRGGNFSEEETQRLLTQVLDRLSEGEIRQSVVVVEKTRIRKHSLPINR